MTTEVNPTLGNVENVIKKLAWDTSVRITLVRMGLDFWPIRDVVTVFTDKLWEIQREAFDVKVIEWLNAAHQAEYDKSCVILKIIAHDKGIESPEFLKAKEAAREAMDNYFTINH